MSQVQLDKVYIYCDTTLNAITITLPPISSMKGLLSTQFFVLDNSGKAGANAITIVTSSSDSISGSNLVNSDYGCLVFTPTDDTHWLSLGGNSSQGDYLFQEVPFQTNYPSFTQQGDVLGRVNDEGLIYNPPYVDLSNGNIAQLGRVLTILSGSIYIFQAWDYQTIDPNPFYWVAMKESSDNSKKLEYLCDLKWTDQFFNQYYYYIDNTSNLNPVTSCRFVNYNSPSLDGNSIESYITTLTYNQSTNTLSAIDSTFTFGGNTFLTLYNNLTGLSLASLSMNYSESIFSANSDFTEFLAPYSNLTGYVYYWDINEANLYTNIIGYNVLTGQTRLIKPYDTLSLTTNFSPIDIYQSIVNVISHPNGIYFILDDQQTTSNGVSLEGVTSIWSPDIAGKQYVKYINNRNEGGQYASTNGDLNNNTFSGMSLLNSPIDVDYLYLCDSPVSTSNACNLIVYRFKLDYNSNDTELDLVSIPFSNVLNYILAVASFPTNKGMLIASFDGTSILPQYSANFHWVYWNNAQLNPSQLQLNTYAPTNYYNNTIYGTTIDYSAVNWNSYGITYDKLNQNF
jgi:hypothetical protein